VICEMRNCLICDGVFTPREAAEHAAIPCGIRIVRSTSSQCNLGKADGVLSVLRLFVNETDHRSSKLRLLMQTGFD